jgi:16S rRNA (guanine966-N2)-methyltransferase
MKILTGFLKGRTLVFEPDAQLRPTTDKVRKAVFDVLQGYPAGKRVLDLYSGTGAMGFEALSQEASFVLFVEKDRFKTKRIESALKRWRLEDSAEVLCMDAMIALEHLKLSGEAFDLVFLDPPYGGALGDQTLRALAKADLLNEGGLVFVETAKKEDLPEKVLNLKVVRDKKYGQSRLRVYRKKGPDSAI